MLRRALIIGNPGTPGQKNYCAGVLKDVDNYRNFLMSPQGGAWNSNEIETLMTPSVLDVDIAIINQKLSTYSVTAFCGHGYYDAKVKSTFVELKSGVEIDSVRLLSGASKHSLILDCCRVVTNETPLVESMMAKADLQKRELDHARARELFDEEVSRCTTGHVVLFGCKIGESAGDNSQFGGLYSYNLLEYTRDWARQPTAALGSASRILSISEAHDMAAPAVVRRTAGRQNPQIERPRVARLFPFAVR